MDSLLEILKYTLPALIVLVAAYLVLQRTLKHHESAKKTEVMLNNQKMLTPLRMQAYERMVLLLERISPQSMIMRTQKPNMSCQDLQNALLRGIRQEFEHNLAQQIYLSDRSWEKVVSAKENLVKTINQVALGLKPDAPAINLSKRLLEHYMNKENDPAKASIKELKKEVRTLY